MTHTFDYQSGDPKKDNWARIFNRSIDKSVKLTFKEGRFASHLPRKWKKAARAEVGALLREDLGRNLLDIVTSKAEQVIAEHKAKR